MFSSLALCLFFLVGGLFFLSWKHVFILLLLVDFLGLSLVLSAGGLGVCGLILLLVMQVYSSVLGISVLVGSLRAVGSDKAKAFL